MAKAEKQQQPNLTAAEQVLVDLVNNVRPPMNEKEVELAKQIQEIKDKGWIVEIPGEVF